MATTISFIEEANEFPNPGLEPHRVGCITASIQQAYFGKRLVSTAKTKEDREEATLHYRRLVSEEILANGCFKHS